MAEKNSYLSGLITELSILGKEAPVWARVAKDLKKPTRIQRKVNLTQLEKYAKEDLTVVVPGKVLGTGVITKKVNVVALAFSESAKEKITKAGGKAIFLSEHIKKNTTSKGVQIMG